MYQKIVYASSLYIARRSNKSVNWYLEGNLSFIVLNLNNVKIISKTLAMMQTSHDFDPCLLATRSLLPQRQLKKSTLNCSTVMLHHLISLLLLSEFPCHHTLNVW